MREFLHAMPGCPNLSPVLPSFGQARVTCLPRHAAVAECQRDIGTGQVAPMASTLSSTQADPRFDGGVAPTVAKDRFTGVEEALTRLAHQAASDTPDARPRVPASDRSAEARISQSFAAATLGPADLRAPIPREQRSLGKRSTLARVAIAVCIGASAILAWRSYGGPAIATWAPPFTARPSADQTPTPQMPDPAPEQAAAPPAVETSAPPPAQAASQAASIAQPATTAANEPGAASAERPQIETMARDLAALRQTVAQLAAGQEQLTREIAKLQAEKPPADKPPTEKPEKRMLRRVSAPAAPPARKPAPITPMPLQAAPQVSTVSPLSPPPQSAPQIPSEPQSAEPPPLRPPMPVPQP
jgi:hypothetical protein